MTSEDLRLPGDDVRGPTSFERPEYKVWDRDFSGWTVSYEKAVTDADGRPIFENLPGRGCACEHWGYVISGESIYEYDDAEEIYRTGDFFYLRPGHRPRHTAGTQWITFSPTQAHRAAQALSRPILLEEAE
jgi:hypothetical protein